MCIHPTASFGVPHLCIQFSEVGEGRERRRERKIQRERKEGGIIFGGGLYSIKHLYSMKSFRKYGQIGW